RLAGDGASEDSLTSLHFLLWTFLEGSVVAGVGLGGREAVVLGALEAAGFVTGAALGAKGFDCLVALGLVALADRYSLMKH
ncbi:hypothetical protein Tco_0402429, partial [Tanacetum coccineum]